MQSQPHLRYGVMHLHLPLGLFAITAHATAYVICASDCRLPRTPGCRSRPSEFLTLMSSWQIQNASLGCSREWLARVLGSGHIQIRRPVRALNVRAHGLSLCCAWTLIPAMQSIIYPVPPVVCLTAPSASPTVGLAHTPSRQSPCVHRNTWGWQRDLLRMPLQPKYVCPLHAPKAASTCQPKCMSCIPHASPRPPA